MRKHVSGQYAQRDSVT